MHSQFLWGPQGDFLKRFFIQTIESPRTSYHFPNFCETPKGNFLINCFRPVNITCFNTNFCEASKMDFLKIFFYRPWNIIIMFFPISVKPPRVFLKSFFFNFYEAHKGYFLINCFTKHRSSHLFSQFLRGPHAGFLMTFFHRPWNIIYAFPKGDL